MKKFAFVFVLLLAGCSHPLGTPVISSSQGAALEQTLVAQGLSFGLGSIKDQVAARAAADQINLIISNTVGPYLSGNLTTVPSNIIDTLLKEQLFTSLPTEVQMLISGAASLANSYLPVPGPTTYLNQDDLNYLRGLINGLQSGANLYLAGHPATKATRGLGHTPIWLNYKSQSH